MKQGLLLQPKEIAEYHMDAARSGYLTRCDFSDGKHRLEDYADASEEDEKRDEGGIPFYRVSRKDVLKGRLPSKLVDRLFKTDDDKKGKKGKSSARQKENAPFDKDTDSSTEEGEDSAEFKKIALEIALVTLRKMEVEEGDHGLADAILSIPVVLYQNGSLGMPQKGDRIPIMPRALLAEEGDAKDEAKESDVFVGSYAAYRQAADGASSMADNVEDWGDYLKAMQKCFDSVVDVRSVAPKLREVGLLLEKEPDYVHICLPRVHATKGIEELGKDIAPFVNNGSLSLYTELVRSQEELPKTRDYGMSLAEAMKRHCGAMGREYPLSPSQRHVIRCHTSDGQSPVLAVSGPPGTGKTTLLQAVVANLVVQKALAGEDAPIIVGSSTNNQAVTNIVDTFANVEQSEGKSIYRRWLPDPSIVGKHKGDQKSLKGIGCFSLPKSAGSGR